MLQIILAGFSYASAGDNAESIENAQTRIWQSILGLILMISSFIVAIIIGALFFGDPTMILNPKIPGAKL